MTARIRLSCKVSQANMPRTTYTANAMTKRCKTNRWCTGEDSNLRSSQGAADLQSAAINHSATCAEMPECPATHSVRQPEKRVCAGAEGRAAHSLGRRKQITTCANILPHKDSPPSGKILMECVLGDPAAVLPLFCANAPCFRKTVSWSWRRDSNPRPSDYKSDALPAELRQQNRTSRPSRAQKVLPLPS